MVRALKVRADATLISLTYFYRPFQGSAANAWPYQALRTSCLHLATFFRLRCRLVVSYIHNSSSGTAKHRPEAVLIDLKFLAEVPVTIPLVALKAALRLRG